MIHINQMIDLYFMVYKLTWNREEGLHFSPQIVGLALRILNMCVLDFCFVSVVWSVWVRGSFYDFLICGLVQVLFFSVVVNF